MLAAETLFKRISLLVSKQKWLMQLNFYHSIAILTDLHLIQGVFERFCNLGAVHKRHHQFYLTFWSPPLPFLRLYINYVFSPRVFIPPPHPWKDGDFIYGRPLMQELCHWLCNKNCLGPISLTYYKMNVCMASHCMARANLNKSKL